VMLSFGKTILLSLTEYGTNRLFPSSVSKFFQTAQRHYRSQAGC
jgi:hypothetical protein